jgi:hypothetical protein
MEATWASLLSTKSLMESFEGLHSGMKNVLENRPRVNAEYDDEDGESC